jgi:hypothetical protein
MHGCVHVHEGVCVYARTHVCVYVHMCVGECLRVHAHVLAVPGATSDDSACLH